MAAVRPLVLVYQEIESTSTVAETPTLDTLIAGPAYHIQDYPVDSDDIEIATYGTKNADSDNITGDPVGLPPTNADATILADPPNNVTGAELDQSSVTVYMEDVYVQVASDIAGAFSTVQGEENQFTSTNGVDFDALGIEQGDRLVATTSNGDTYVLTVQDPTFGTVSKFTTSTNWTDGVATNLLWRLERKLDDGIELPSSFVEFGGNEITIKGGAYYMTDISGDGTDQQAQINYAQMFVEYRALRADLAKVTDVTESNIETVLGIVDERNPLAAGVQVALENTVTSVKAWGVDGDNLNGANDRAAAYTAMTSLIESRADMYAIVPLTQESSIVDSIHQHAVDFSTPEKSKFRAVFANNNTLPSVKTISGPAKNATTEQSSPTDTVVFSSGSQDFADQGVRADDELYVVDSGSGNVTLQGYTVTNTLDNERLYSDDLGGETGGSDTLTWYIFRGTTGIVDRELPDVEFTGAATITVNTGSVQASDVGKVLRLKGIPGGNANENNSPLNNNDYLIIAADTGAGTYTVLDDGTTVLDAATFAADVVDVVDSVISNTAVEVRAAFDQLLDNSATFSTAGVIAGDFLEVPSPAVANGTDFSSVYQAEVGSVISENRILLASGEDILTTDVTAAQTDLGYRVVRSLDKEGQKDQILTNVDEQTGYNSSRLVLIWPDEVLLTNVENNKTSTRSRQPGYYLACAVGGMSAGLPPHQGFTYLGINGIDEIYNSSRYFSEGQLTEISNGGYYLFLQDTLSTQPYGLHQLTTDTSNLQNSELSLRRTFDYVSRFYKDIIDDFIGKYNVTPQTLDILREAINNGSRQLASDSRPRIGAPIINADITSLNPLEGQRDRVEIYLDVEFPAPLNRVGVHLVA